MQSLEETKYRLHLMFKKQRLEDFKTVTETFFAYDITQNDGDGSFTEEALIAELEQYFQAAFMHPDGTISNILGIALKLGFYDIARILIGAGRVSTTKVIGEFGKKDFTSLHEWYLANKEDLELEDLEQFSEIIPGVESITL